MHQIELRAVPIAHFRGLEHSAEKATVVGQHNRLNHIVGISDIQAARESMFTTKPEQERSGLGFTVMEAFMDELCISSVSNEGTTVTMRKRIDQKRSMDMS